MAARIAVRVNDRSVAMAWLVKSVVALLRPTTGQQRPGHVDQPVGGDALQTGADGLSATAPNGGFPFGECAPADLCAGTQEPARISCASIPSC